MLQSGSSSYSSLHVQVATTIVTAVHTKYT